MLLTLRKLNVLKPHFKLQMSRSSTLSQQEKLSIRPASLKEMGVVTREVIREGWHVGPYDFTNAYSFDPKGFMVGELNNKLTGHVHAFRYPNHSTFIGGRIIWDAENRGKGHGKALYSACFEASDKNHTIGGDTDITRDHWFEEIGFKVYWDTYIAMLNQEKVVHSLNGFELPPRVTVKPLNSVSLSKLLDYDSFIFGTPRHVFIKGWINTVGSFGFVALRDSDIVGYTILRQVIRDGGTQIGLAMAPLYADNVHIAKALIKTASKECLDNKAVPKTKLELVHPVGKCCGEGSSELMEELEAELNHIALRIYSKGIPPGRKTEKIYGIASPSFD